MGYEPLGNMYACMCVCIPMKAISKHTYVCTFKYVYMYNENNTKKTNNTNNDVSSISMEDKYFLLLVLLQHELVLS